MQEILNINVDQETKTLSDSLNINSQILNEFQLRLKKLFMSNYVLSRSSSKASD